MSDVYRQLHLWEPEASTAEYPTDEPTSSLTINIPTPLKAQLKNTCSKNYLNMTEVVNELIKDWLKEN